MDRKCINTIKCLSVDMINKANSGHPGMPLGCAPIAHVLWSRIMKYNPEQPLWFNRDRFILSNGHGCALLYSMLHLTGYNYSVYDLQCFRQIDSKTPGHPERDPENGIEVTTGPLGQGLSNGVGMALAEKHLQTLYNKPDFEIINNNIFVMCGDGCLMEGISYESASLAGHLGLGNLIVLYDDNNITIDGNTDITFTEDIDLRFKSMNWHVDYIDDPNDLDNVENVIQFAKLVKDKPSLIRIKTLIGEGSLLEGSSKSHGAPLKKEDIEQLKQKLNFSEKEPFTIQSDVMRFYETYVNENRKIFNKWHNDLVSYSQKYSDEYGELKRRLYNDYDDMIDNIGPPLEQSQLSTRQLSGLYLNNFSSFIPSLMGGSADLAGSNCSKLTDSGSFQKGNYVNRNINFGVREHGMFGIANGMNAYGATIPYVATFLNFLTYGYGAVRLSALSKHQVLYLMTHDSIGLGEDGPTHQPIEVLNLCRQVPNLYTFRPADENEVIASYKSALKKKSSPSVLSLTRQKLPLIKGSCIQSALMGGYTLINEDYDKKLQAIIIATGSELSIAVDVAQQLNHNIRVVSMPCWEIFIEQTDEYKTSVLPNNVTKISIEAGSTQFWKGITDYQFGIDTFGKSGPGDDLYKYFGLTVQNIKHKIDILKLD